MTINGPAPMMLAFFLNAAIDQQCEKYIIENNLRESINAIIESKFNPDLFQNIQVLMANQYLRLKEK